MDRRMRNLCAIPAARGDGKGRGKMYCVSLCSEVEGFVVSDVGIEKKR